MQSLLLLHAVAAQRGDGLLPELVVQLERTKAAHGLMGPRYLSIRRPDAPAQRPQPAPPNASKK
jgi:hypothetical protein